MQRCSPPCPHLACSCKLAMLDDEREETKTKSCHVTGLGSRGWYRLCLEWHDTPDALLRSPSLCSALFFSALLIPSSSTTPQPWSTKLPPRRPSTLPSSSGSRSAGQAPGSGWERAPDERAMPRARALSSGNHVDPARRFCSSPATATLSHLPTRRPARRGLPAHTRYWGKRDTKLILPTNSSLSVTLDQDHLRSTTTSRADESFSKDRLWLNGKEEVIKEGGRLHTCIKELRAWRAEEESKQANLPKVSSRCGAVRSCGSWA